MARPHILIIPPWFDIDFQHHFSKSYHRWAQDLALRNQAQVGLLFGEFHSGFRSREIFQKDDMDYQYLGIRSWGLPKAGPGWMVWERQYIRAFREYVEKNGRPSVIHGFSLLGVIVAGAIHRQFKIPYVYTEVLGSFISGKVAPRLVRKARKVASQAYMVCGISPDMVRAMEKAYDVEPRLIPLYLDTDIFKPTSMPSKPPRIISIGSPALTKGMDILIEAMIVVTKSWSDARLMIVCEARDKVLLEDLIHKHHLQKSVTLLGPVPYKNIPGLIAASHLLVSASREESFGYTILEALSLGRPVVASSSPGARYIVSKGHGRIVEISDLTSGADPVELGREITNTLHELPAYTPEKLHEYVRDRFGKDKVLDQWMDNYKRASITDNR